MSESFLVDPKWLAERRNEDNLVIIDTGSEAEYVRGHVPGAILLDVYAHKIEDSRSEGLPAFHDYVTGLCRTAGIQSGKETIVFYETGTGMYSARGLWLFRYAGLRNSHVLQGGAVAWQEAGLALSTKMETPTASKFKIDPDETVLARIDEIDPDNCVILDVREYGEFVGEANSRCCPRAGRIPGSVFFHWGRMLSEDKLTYLPGPQIKAELEQEGITRNRDIIVYCHRGARAASVWLGLKNLQFPRVRNFIGSWHEWARRLDLPLSWGEPSIESIPTRKEPEPE